MIKAQFTYTSTDGVGVLGGSTYGWKVKEAKSAGGQEVPLEDIRWATSKLGVYAVIAVPNLATKEEIAKLPRTVRMEISGTGLVNLTHRAPAGKEATGRPNTFVHGMLLKKTDGPTLGDPVRRPSDIIDSPLWLEPLGAEAVNGTWLGDPPGSDGTPSQAPAVTEKWLSSHRGAQAVLLAAFEQAHREDRVLIILADEPEAGMACVCQIESVMLAEAAWNLPFSTYESLASGSSASSVIDGVKICVIPRKDAAKAATIEHALIIDMGAERTASEDGWMVGDVSVPIGPWSGFLMQVISSALDDELSQALDRLGQSCGHSADKFALWGAPAAFLLLSDEDARSVDGLLSQAVSLTIQEMPPGVHVEESVARQLVSHMGEVGDAGLPVITKQLMDLDKRWQPDMTSVFSDVVYSAYLAAILNSPDDQNWIPSNVALSSQALMDFISGLSPKVAELTDPASVAKVIEWSLDVMAHNGLHSVSDCQPLMPQLSNLLDWLFSAVCNLLCNTSADFPALAPIPQFAWDIGFRESVSDLLSDRYSRYLNMQSESGTVNILRWLSIANQPLMAIAEPSQLRSLGEADLAYAAFRYDCRDVEPSTLPPIPVLRAAALQNDLRACSTAAEMVMAWRRTCNRQLDKWTVSVIAGLTRDPMRGQTCVDFIGEVLKESPLGEMAHVLARVALGAMPYCDEVAVLVHNDAWETTAEHQQVAAASLWIPSMPNYTAADRGSHYIQATDAFQRSCVRRMAQLFILQPIGAMFQAVVNQRYTPGASMPKDSGLGRYWNSSELWMDALEEFANSPESATTKVWDLAGVAASRWACAPYTEVLDPFGVWLNNTKDQACIGEHLAMFVQRIATLVGKENASEIQKSIDRLTSSTANTLGEIARKQGITRKDSFGQIIADMNKRLSFASKDLSRLQGA